MNTRSNYVFENRGSRSIPLDVVELSVTPLTVIAVVKVIFLLSGVTGSLDNAAVVEERNGRTGVAFSADVEPVFEVANNVADVVSPSGYSDGENAAMPVVVVGVVGVVVMVCAVMGMVVETVVGTVVGMVVEIVAVVVSVVVVILVVLLVVVIVGNG